MAQIVPGLSDGIEVQQYRFRPLSATQAPVLATNVQSPDEKMSAVQLYLQLGPQTHQMRALQLLCHQMLRTQLFNILRTQQQLGYAIEVDPVNDEGTLGMVVGVKSEFPPSRVVEAISSALDQYAETLPGMSDADFKAHKDSAMDSVAQPTSIEEQVDDHWGRICNPQHHGDRHRQINFYFEQQVLFLHWFETVFELFGFGDTAHRQCAFCTRTCATFPSPPAGQKAMPSYGYEVQGLLKSTAHAKRFPNINVLAPSIQFIFFTCRCLTHWKTLPRENSSSFTIRIT